jgi:spermidine synthase
LGAYSLIFFVAGVPALLYQVVWQRILTLYFGVDVYSAAVTVSAFMTGLGLGALLGGALADRLRRTDYAYALSEGLLAVLGALSVPVLESVGTKLAGANLGLTFLVSFVLLVLPTLLMGMTFPLMVKVLAQRRGEALGADLAWLYGSNTLGASAGAILGSYVLIGWLGLYGVAQLSAVVNLVVAACVLLLGRGGAGVVQESAALLAPSPQGVSNASELELTPGRVIELAFLSGAVALGFEVVGYRILQVILHTTTYVFGTILGVLLLAMGLGALLARGPIERPGPARRFGIAQAVMAAYFLLAVPLFYFDTSCRQVFFRLSIQVLRSLPAKLVWSAFIRCSTRSSGRPLCSAFQAF